MSRVELNRSYRLGVYYESLPIGSLMDYGAMFVPQQIIEECDIVDEWLDKYRCIYNQIPKILPAEAILISGYFYDSDERGGSWKEKTIYGKGKSSCVMALTQNGLITRIDVPNGRECFISRGGVNFYVHPNDIEYYSNEYKKISKIKGIEPQGIIISKTKIDSEDIEEKENVHKEDVKHKSIISRFLEFICK